MQELCSSIFFFSIFFIRLDPNEDMNRIFMCFDYALLECYFFLTAVFFVNDQCVFNDANEVGMVGENVKGTSSIK